jgi:hypothetical protein
MIRNGVSIDFAFHLVLQFLLELIVMTNVLEGEAVGPSGVLPSVVHYTLGCYKPW